MLISDLSERIWCILHSSLGLLLLCGWYLPPMRGEVDSIMSFLDEFERLRHQACSTIIFGDIHVHQLRWLQYSRENIPSGSMLESFAANNGFIELIRQPTRGKYLLSFFLSDFIGTYEKNVLPSITDYMCTQMKIQIFVLRPATPSREFWNFGAADWRLIFQKLSLAKWNMMDAMDVDELVSWLNARIKMIMFICVPKMTHISRQSSHLWINDYCLFLVRTERFPSWSLHTV